MYAVGGEWSIPQDVLETMMEEALSFIIGLETYKQVREPLVGTFIQSMKDREVMLLDNFRCAKKGTHTVAKYVQEFKCLCDALAMIQCLISDSLQFVIWLGFKIWEFCEISII